MGKRACYSRRIWFFPSVFFMLIFPLFSLDESSKTDSDEVSFTLHLPAVSPCFVLLGKEPASVESPGNMADFAVTILGQTENFAKIPDNYAVEFSPCWAFAGKRITFKKFSDNKNVWNNILQTFSFSIATTSESKSDSDSESSSRSVALGIRFSLKRGEMQRRFYDENEKIDELLNSLNKPFDEEFRKRITEDPVCLALDGIFKNLAGKDEATVSQIAKAKEKRQEEIKNEIIKSKEKEIQDKIENIKEIISNLPFKRIKFKIDVAGGAAFDFPQNSFEGGDLKKLGVWFTSGYEWENACVLGVVRFLKDGKNSKENSLDLGGRILFDSSKKFSFSTEAVYRRFLHESSNPGQWRLAILCEYQVAKNKIVSFTFGRNFKGEKEGNLISMINLIMGFGSDRPVR